MTEAGKKLFKKAFMILGGLIGVMLLLRMISSFQGESKKDETVASGPALSAVAQWEPEDQQEPVPDIVEYSARGRLVKLLHKQAFNNYRAGRLKDSIRQWEIAATLEPANMIVGLRLNQARGQLNYLIDENRAIATQDLQALRYERALEYYRRAANYANGFNRDEYDEIMRQITRTEKRLMQ